MFRITMNSKKEIITLDGFKGENIGIKIVLVTNKKTNENLAIITDVNPSSCCHSENIATGDILLSINGMEINNLQSLVYINRMVTTDKNVVLRMEIIRKGALDGSDLLKRCMDSPCSETCELWNENEVKITRTNKFPDIQIPRCDSLLYSLQSAKTGSVDDILLSKSQKISTTSIEQLGSVPTKSMPIYNKSTINYHQKALPMNIKKKQPNTTVIRKSNHNSDKDMIASPPPHFIKRPSARQYENSVPGHPLKPTKSLTDLSDVTNHNKSSSSSETVSTSSSSSPSQRFAPRKTSLPSADIPYKPTPKPRTKHITLVHTRSIESRKFQSLTPSTDNQHLPQRPSNLPHKPSPKRYNHVMSNDNKVDHQRIRDNNTYQINKSGDVNESFVSLPPFGTMNLNRP